MKIRYTIMEAQRFQTYALAGAAIDAESDNTYEYRFSTTLSGILVKVYNAGKHEGYL